MNRNSTPYSQLKVFYHPEILQHLLKGERCNPVYIRIKPTNRCNHNCSYCHYKNAYLDLDDFNPGDEIPREKMMETIEGMHRLGVKAVTFSGGGEPLLYPHIEESMERILDAGIDLSIITNGSLLSGGRAELLARSKWVRLSIESVNDEEYCRIRGISKGAFNRLCGNISDFAQIKNTDCELGVNVVVNAENCFEIESMAKLMKELGVNHVKYSPMITNDTNSYHAPFREKVTKSLVEVQNKYGDDHFRIIDLYTGDFSDSVIFDRQYSKCPMKEFICVIAANQKVYFCQDKAYLSDGEVGSIKEQSFADLWVSDDTTRKFRDFDAKKICGQHCVHDSRNKLLNSFIEMDRNHINFI